MGCQLEDLKLWLGRKKQYSCWQHLWVCGWEENGVLQIEFPRFLFRLVFVLVLSDAARKRNTCLCKARVTVAKTWDNQIVAIGKVHFGSVFTIHWPHCFEHVERLCIAAGVQRERNCLHYCQGSQDNQEEAGVPSWLCGHAPSGWMISRKAPTYSRFHQFLIMPLHWPRSCKVFKMSFY